MNYEEMRDFEINRRVGKIIFELEGKEFRTTNPMNNVVEFITGLGDEREFNYFNGCNNPSDAWPIILENHISLTTDGCGHWNADVISCISSDDEEYNFKCETITGMTQNKNPLRAAMICFLKMKDAE